jgi:hypothetical protein
MEQVVQGLDPWTIGFISRNLVDEQQERDPAAKPIPSLLEDDLLPFLRNPQRENVPTYIFGEQR